MPTTNGVASATVIIDLKGKEALPAAWIDALDTPAWVLGPQKGVALLESQGVHGVLIQALANKKLKAFWTKGSTDKLKLSLEY